jgi:hypothetical protein
MLQWMAASAGAGISPVHCGLQAHFVLALLPLYCLQPCVLFPAQTAGRKIVYFTFGDEKLQTKLHQLRDLMLENGKV